MQCCCGLVVGPKPAECTRVTSLDTGAQQYEMQRGEGRALGKGGGVGISTMFACEENKCALEANSLPAGQRPCQSSYIRRHGAL